MSIKLETLSGQTYGYIDLKETDTEYSDIIKYIKRTCYPEFNPSKYDIYTIYIKTDIKLFNKGNLINFDDDISFDKEDSVLQIFIKYEYLCYDWSCKIYNFTEENMKDKIIDLIKTDGRFIGLMIKEDQIDELCKLAIQQTCWALQYIKCQTEDICKLAVQKDGYALQYVRNQTEDICKLAVQQNGETLKYVKEQTEEICKLAVDKHGYSVKDVKEQTEEICALAVKKNGLALYHVKKQTDNVCKLAVQQNGLALYYVKDKTMVVCKFAVQQNYDALKYVPLHMTQFFN